MTWTGTPLSLADGTRIPRIGLGCMGMSEFYGVRDDDASLRVLLAAYECGTRHFDTADFYGQGHNEELVARFLAELRGNRENVFVATKCGLRRLAGPTPAVEIDSRPEYVREACHASLKRLGVDHVDLFYLHRRSSAVPIEDTMGAMAELVREGKCRYVGLSEVSEATLRRANAVHPVAALQSEYSLWTRDVEDAVLAATRELGIALVAYSPIGRGFLSGTLTREKTREAGDLRGLLPRFGEGNFEQNALLLGELQRVADELGGVTMSQVALAWVLSRGQNIYAIPGTRNTSHLQANVAAEHVVLNEQQVERLSSAFSPEAVQGARYPEALLRTVNT
jgi:aryl-alcohol dehydrogenase-like predicted oxidoreductase